VKKASSFMALLSALHSTCKLQSYAGKVFTEVFEVESHNIASTIFGLTGLAKTLEFLHIHKDFAGAEMHEAWIAPRQFDQFFHMICDECVLVVLL